MMAELRDRGTAILLATHDMAEAEKLSNRLAILLNGKIVAAGTPKEITASGNGATKVSVCTVDGRLLEHEVSLPWARRVEPRDRYAVYFSEKTEETLLALLKVIADSGDTLVDLRVERPSLEERFLEITENGGNE